MSCINMTNMENIQILESVGVRAEDGKIYLALLENGSASIRQVAALTDINRGSVYEGLKRLSALGLVSFSTKGERRKYVAEGPEAINVLIEERRRELATTAEAAKDLIPQLAAIGGRQAGEPVVRFYEDDEGVVAILRDVLATVSQLPTKEYYVYSSRPLRRYIYRRFPNFTQRRLKLGVSVKAIAIGEGGDPTEMAERKWLPEPSQAQLSSYVIVYGDKVALISVSADDTPYGVMIEEPGVAAMQKFLFEQLWQTIK